MLKVFIKDFQIIGQTRLDIDGLTFLVGSGDNGKSSVVRAMQYGIYNKLGDDFIRQGVNGCSVALKFNDDFKFAWKKSRGKGGEYLLPSGEYGKLGKSDFEGVVEEGLLPLTTSVGDFYLNFWNQMEQFLVVNRPDTHKFEILSSIFSGEKYQEMLKKVGDDLKAVQKACSNEYMKKEMLSGYVASSTDKLQLFSDIDSIKNEVSKLSMSVDRLDTMSSLLERHTTTEGKLSSMTDTAATCTKIVSFFVKKQGVVVEDIDELKNIDSKYRLVLKARDLRNSIKTLEEYCSAASVKLVVSKSDVDKCAQMESLLQLRKVKLVTISAMSSKLEDTLFKLKEEEAVKSEFDTCPFCGK